MLPDHCCTGSHRKGLNTVKHKDIAKLCREMTRLQRSSGRDAVREYAFSQGVAVDAQEGLILKGESGETDIYFCWDDDDSDNPADGFWTYIPG
jgi:hypothetical protein